MLQRAASNAYSWWWASHVRTKQSKWLEQSLQDMEEKVHYVLKLIQEDGDSFAKRAEMYYKKRPELIHFVEDSYKAFRALAERYDHLSTELQNANTTIASVFPEQVQFAMDEEDEYGAPRIPKNFPQVPSPDALKVPQVPRKVLRGLLTTTSKNLQTKDSTKTADKNNTVAKSGLNKSEAVEEIDKVQKEMLALQTEKEFVKSSYECALAKYWGIESEIMEMQRKVCSLQDEFSIGRVIEDDEARTLMAEAALKSCQETLAQLQEKQESSTQEAREEYKRIEDARQRLESLKHQFFHDQMDEEKPNDTDGSKKELKQEESGGAQEVQKLEVLQEKVKEHFETDSEGSLMVTELAEKINELVTKVISLESAVSSQTTLIDRLKTESDDLQAQIRSLEDDKATLIDGTHNMSSRLREMKQKLHGVQDLNESVENQYTHLQAHFTKARCSIDQLSEKLQCVKTDEELEVTGSLREEEESLVEVKSQEEFEKQKDMPGPGDGFNHSNTLKTEEKENKNVEVVLSASSVTNQGGEDKESDITSEKCQVSKPQDKVDKQDLSPTAESHLNIELQGADIEEEEELHWQQMLLNGLEDKEKILLTEYTTILRNYKDVKKKLSEVEKENQDKLFETTLILRGLKSAITKRDKEIQSLRQRLNILQASLGENNNLKEDASDLLDDPTVKLEARDSDVNEDLDVPLSNEEEECIKSIFTDQPQTSSPIEEKLRLNIDAILDDNLDFWLRFSTAFHQVQKFRTEVQDLLAEIKQLKTKDMKKQEEKSNTSMFTRDLKSDVRPIYKHLTEIQTELTVWLEQSALLKDELQRRFLSLCNIQEQITIVLREGVEEDIIKFGSHQAAKFQGEILNMKQENKKVREELQACLDHVTALRLETQKTLAGLNEEFGLSGTKNHNQQQLRHSTRRPRVPLRSFLFGVKPKKQRRSIFSCVYHHRKYPHPRPSHAL